MPEQPLIPVANPPWAGPQGLLAPPPAPAWGVMQRHGSALKAMVALAVLVLAILAAALAVWLPYSMQQQMLSPPQGDLHIHRHFGGEQPLGQRQGQRIRDAVITANMHRGAQPAPPWPRRLYPRRRLA